VIKNLIKACALTAGLLLTSVAAKADIADGKFSTNQIFDVQYYWSGTTLNASNFIAPYDANFRHPTVAAGDYFQFFNSTTNPGTYGLGLYTSAGALKQVVHNTGTLQAIGPGALFYIGSGFFGTVISTGAGYAYGQSGTFTNMNTSPSAGDFTGYTWASTTPLAAGQTAGAPVTPPAPSYVSVNSTVTNVYATSANSPALEKAVKALDLTSSTKYLNFDRTNSGFTVQLPAGKAVSALRFTTANDFEPRDPSKFTLKGSNDGVNWTDIVTNQAITLSSGRQTTGSDVTFTNTTPYVYYYITFTSIKAIDTYGSVAGCQAALGTLSCDSVQIGDVNFLTDSSNTATSANTGNGTIVNPGTVQVAGTPQTSTGATTPTGPGTSTSVRTPSGAAVAGTPVITRGTTVVTTSTGYTSANNGNTVDVTRTIVTTRTTPVNTNTPWVRPILVTVTTVTPVTTTVTTTPVTYIKDSNGVILNTIYGTPVTTTTATNQTTTSTSTSSDTSIISASTMEVLSSSASSTKSASAAGISDVMKDARTNPFIVDALSTKDGAWITPTFSRTTTTGRMNAKTMSGGWQQSADGNTGGFAFSATNSDSAGYINSRTTGESYSAVVYAMTKQDYVWLKGTVGASKGVYNSTVGIPEFGLSGKSKAAQTNTYADVTVYAADDLWGFRPFVGATLVRSSITDAWNTSPLLATAPAAKTTVQANPYVGLRYDVNDNIAIEARDTQTRDLGNVKSIKATVRQQIIDDVSINASISYARGHNYTNTTGMVGLDWRF
jgi:hypothetical protein